MNSNTDTPAAKTITVESIRHGVYYPTTDATVDADLASSAFPLVVDMRAGN